MEPRQPRSAKSFTMHISTSSVPRNLHWQLHYLTPSSSASLAISFFGFYKVIKDWWVKGFDDIHQLNTSEDSLLHVAVEGGTTSVVRHLVEHGLDVDKRVSSGTPLQRASRGGKIELARLLLEMGANVNASSRYFGRALCAASERGNVAMVELSLKNGAEVALKDTKEDTALQAASRSNNIEVMKVLINNGADIRAEGGKDGSALHAAAFGHHVNSIKLLIDRGVNLNHLVAPHGTALLAALQAIHRARRKETIETLDFLLENGADVNAQTPNYSPSHCYGSALQAAAHGYDIELVKTLLG